jgi:hydroxyacylglutathione hydrolase
MFKFLFILTFVGNGILTSLSPYDFFNLLGKQTDVLLLDVRIKAEYEVEHIASAQWAGSEMALDSIVANYPKQEPVFIYCDYGQRTKSVVKLLKKKRFKQIIELEGGLELWKEQGFPLSKNNIQ